MESEMRGVGTVDCWLCW